MPTLSMGQYGRGGGGVNLKISRYLRYGWWKFNDDHSFCSLSVESCATWSPLMTFVHLRIPDDLAAPYACQNADDTSGM